MKYLILLCLISVAASFKLNQQDVNEEFEFYRLKFNRLYDSVGELNARKAIFEQNLKLIYQHNIEADDGVHSYRIGINQFADLTLEEWSRQQNGLKINLNTLKNLNPVYTGAIDDLPDSVDWRTKGIVTPVKNQNNCNAGWAFSVVAAIEGQHALSTKKLVSLSEQNVVDCTYNAGCSGGYTDMAFLCVQLANGIDTESSYPYLGQETPCSFEMANVGANITDFTQVTARNESALQAAVANIGPVSVGVDAFDKKFQFYQSGIYDNPSCHSDIEYLSQATAVVGYGIEDGKDFWLVKNSWGIAWGEEGYIRMIRNKNNQCGIATNAYFPTGVH